MSTSRAKREELIDAHLDIANSIAISVWKKAPQHNEKDELISLARLGLMQSIDRWDSYCKRRGFDYTRYEYFTPYAVRRMRGVILDELRKSDWATRSARDKIKNMVANGLGVGATEDELVESTGYSLKEVRELKAVQQLRPSSLDAAESEWNGSLAYSDATDEMGLLLRSFLQAITGLSPEEQTMLALKIFEHQDAKYIAAQLGVTSPYVTRTLNDITLRVHAQLLAAAAESYKQESPEPVTHWVAGNVTKCCGKWMDQLPETDTVTSKESKVTCDKY